MLKLYHGSVWCSRQREILPLVIRHKFEQPRSSRRCGSVSSSSSRGSDDLEKPTVLGREKAKPFEDIPGPKSLPFVGTLYLYLPFIGKYSFGRLHHTGLKKLREFGPIVREELISNVNLLLLFDPQDIEMMYATEGRYPMRRSHIALQKYRLDRPEMYNSGGLLPTNGEEWWKLRSPAQKVLSRPQSVLSRLSVVSEIAQEFVDLIDILRNAETGLIPDFLDLEKRLFLELTMAATLDVRLGCIDKDSPFNICQEATDLIKASDDSNSTIFSTDNGLQLWKKFNTPTYKKLTDGQDTIYRIAYKYVDAKDQELKSRLEDYDNPQTVLEYFLLRSGLDKKDIVSVFCDTLLAGTDTGSFTLSYALYNLATNPIQQELLAQEACDLLSQSDGKVTKVVLAKAKYLKAVVKESNRLNPISIGVGRISVEGTVIRGYNIPKGTVIVTQNQVSCRLPEYFENPDKFLPERWFTKDAINPFLVLPFGHGPRACIGRRMAEQNLYAALVMIAANYKIGWKGRKLDCYSTHINEPDTSLDFTFTPRK
ncbi:cytochrome P450 302a1, mitochondrial-like [Palaemon carinicauda]|uniref:cytochrome P450 302a1, mitochondrial-like n=1 Tax=Palaemon carinicauda TaxID=392227 RepID=UPI0035B5F697